MTELERMHALHRFIESMAYKLSRDVYKGTWRNNGVRSLLNSLKLELIELEQAIDEADNAAIVLECADVANYCMMIADVVQDVSN